MPLPPGAKVRDNMALTMVHLLVAELWARRHPEYLDSPEYYLGAISPDAMHIRFRDDKSRKDEFHLYNWQSLHREPVVAYWRERRAPFDIGYGVHVLTDCQWVPRYRDAFPGIILPNGRLNTEIYYNDTFVTDFALMDEIPRLRDLLDVLEAATPPEDHPLLTAGEFDAWRRVNLDAYRGECPRHDPVTFITPGYVKRFAEESIDLIEAIHGEAFGEH